MLTPPSPLGTEDLVEQLSGAMPMNVSTGKLCRLRLTTVPHFPTTLCPLSPRMCDRVVEMDSLAVRVSRVSAVWLLVLSTARTCRLALLTVATALLLPAASRAYRIRRWNVTVP